MVDVHDRAIRNAHAALPYQTFVNDAADFSAVQGSDKFTTELIDQTHLSMAYSDVPYASNADGQFTNIIGIISPGVYFDIQRQSDDRAWLIPKAYGDPTSLLNYEVGTYKNVRWIVTPKATLYNCGTVTQQTTVTAAIHAGDGTPDPNTTKVDATWRAGQHGATHYIQLAGGTDMTAYKKGQIVSIHKTRTSAYGVTNGVDFNEGTLHDRRIISIDSGNHRLVFDKPIMEDFLTDLGGGVYAYVTLGTHIHMTTFLGGPDAIVGGVAQSPMFYTPEPIDDTKSVYRVSWDSYEGWNSFNPTVERTVFSGGSVKGLDGMLQG